MIGGFESAKHPLYKTWASMKTRCTNKKFRNFNIYGGKGITVCKRWESFESFAADMGDRPSKFHTLDRIDGNKGYEPENVRWADRLTQARNTTRVKLVDFMGESRCLSEWARLLNINIWTLRARIKNGWSIDDALKKPANPYPKRSVKNKSCRELKR